MDNAALLKKTIVQQLKSQHPEKIILFGSLASGRFSNQSDVDLLIVKNTQDKPQDRYPRFRLLLDLDRQVDLFVLTEEELKERMARSFFFREIIEKGEVLYERSKEREYHLA